MFSTFPLETTCGAFKKADVCPRPQDCGLIHRGRPEHQEFPKIPQQFQCPSKPEPLSCSRFSALEGVLGEGACCAVRRCPTWSLSVVCVPLTPGLPQPALSHLPFPLPRTHCLPLSTWLHLLIPPVQIPLFPSPTTHRTFPLQHLPYSVLMFLIVWVPVRGSLP